MCMCRRAGPLSGWDVTAVAAAVSSMAELAGTAGGLRVSGPPGGFAAWRKKVEQLSAGKVSDDWASEEKGAKAQKGSRPSNAANVDANAFLCILRARLLELEAYLYAATGTPKGTIIKLVKCGWLSNRLLPFHRRGAAACRRP